MVTAGATPKIQVENLQKSFGSKQVLRNINLRVDDGESLVVIGGSGSGKSVLLKNILGLMQPDSGDIKVDGESTVGLRSRQREKLMHRFGMLFQGGALFDSLPVWQNIAFTYFFNEGMGKDEARAVAVEKLKQVGLSENEADNFPAELSGGMQKRVSLARAICGNPEVIFFDEPTTGLDPIMADVINNLIVDCNIYLNQNNLLLNYF